MIKRIAGAVAALALAFSGVTAVGSPVYASVSPTRYYAGGQATPAVGKTAFAGSIYVANPSVDTNDQSMMEMTVQASGAGYSPQYQQAILGIGWRKYNGNVTVFAERFRNGAWGGSLVGIGDGWVDYAGNPVNLGSVIPTGAGKSFQWIYDATAPAKWWGYYDGVALGYYPLSIWSSGTAPTFTFDKGQFFQAYGEVYDDDTTVSPCTDMGNGTLSSAAGTKAFFSALRYATGDNAVMTWGNDTNPSWYSSTSVSGNAAFIGGPGSTTSPC